MLELLDISFTPANLRFKIAFKKKKKKKEMLVKDVFNMPIARH